MENEQTDYEVDTAQLQAKVRQGVGLETTCSDCFRPPVALLSCSLALLSTTGSPQRLCGVLFCPFHRANSFAQANPAVSLAQHAHGSE